MDDVMLNSVKTPTRRTVMMGAAGMSLAAAPLSVLLANPDLAAAAADELERVGIVTGSGRMVSGYLARPAKAPAATIALVHEWWGLNDQIKVMAREFAKEGYLAIAVDLMDGQVATTPDQAKAQMSAVKPEEATESMAAWIEWLRGHPEGTGKVATCGWCFGGGWSLNGSIAAPVDATVVYYGRVNRSAADLASLKGPVLGHFATMDKFINKEMVDGFTAEMAKAGKSLTTHWYDADHAFANPSGARYDKDDAALAWERTLAFLKTTLG